MSAVVGQQKDRTTCRNASTFQANKHAGQDWQHACAGLQLFSKEEQA